MTARRGCRLLLLLLLLVEVLSPALLLLLLLPWSLTRLEEEEEGLSPRRVSRSRRGTKPREEDAEEKGEPILIGTCRRFVSSSDFVLAVKLEAERRLHLLCLGDCRKAQAKRCR